MTDITISINETDKKILENSTPNINDWVQGAVNGKIHRSWEKFQSEWTTKLMNDESFTDPIPSNKNDFVNLVTARSDYKTAQQRNQEALASQTEESSE